MYYRLSYGLVTPLRYHTNGSLELALCNVTDSLFQSQSYHVNGPLYYGGWCLLGNNLSRLNGSEFYDKKYFASN